MTREDKRAYNYARDRLANDDYPVYSDEYELKLAYKAGIEDAKNHPHWISVEDELPPRWETNPNVSVQVITCKYVDRELQDIDMQRYVFGDGKWQYGDATHWMPFQFPKKGGEE